ncbi:ureidoglycolate lyase [Sulfitobacter sp. KE29]|jgi:ureidoglycolate lyase|uniref:ureidoglycolate lyase n=1 Tax=Sulfitobacter TaxID=60136 RepID=UPI0007C3F2AE|nr:MULTISPECIES: ureidoglycolate lyase [Sulfitobacter]MBL93873.1 Ureidoglycolate hydrolase [Magnetovibrio sp.]KZY51705.1 Ureidoglycolate hydrolase [Sulfitobacter sp. HI0054]MBO9440043.1 ureidoglycolate lyase [Sulfitobacter sp. R18_2]MDF3419864.1 ureidoglycolate lyase [Sulfitobacter sp. Ks38]MDF3427254.1 ureidoglycolate lyase [Sulfitobacter sp. KE29]
MSNILTANKISSGAIAGLAELIDASDMPDKLINQGRCGRFHDRATLDVDGRLGVSVFQSESFSMPFTMEMMERHPLGSQAFMPMQEGEYLVVLAEDKDGAPFAPRAFIAGSGQAVNIGRNVWHGVLCPLSDPGLFIVVDRVSDGPNLEEHWFDEPFIIER